MNRTDHRNDTHTPAIVGVYEDPAAAREGIETLQAHGIDSVHIGLHGGRTGEATDREVQRRIDRRETARLGWRMVPGALVGGLLGAALGAGIGASVTSGGTVVVAAIVLAVFGAVTGIGVGALGRAAGTPGQSSAWERTFAGLEDGQALVTVHADDPLVLDNAERSLHRTAATRVERLEPGQRPGSGTTSPAR